MGLVIPVSISQWTFEAFPRFMADPHLVSQGIVELASMIHDQWPLEIMALRPSKTSWDLDNVDPRTNAIMGIAIDLVL